MPLTTLLLQIANPSKADLRESVEFLLDSGTVYSFVPRDVLSRLGITPHSRQRFRLADGSVHERDRSDALYLYGNREGAAPVIFAEPGDAALLGAVTLASLGLLFDGIRHELVPLPMIVYGASQSRRQLLDLRGKATWNGSVDRLRKRTDLSVFERLRGSERQS